jgi:hypothetical protein
LLLNVTKFVLGINPFIYLRNIEYNRENSSKGVSKCESSLKQLEELSPWDQGKFHLPINILDDVQFLHHRQGEPYKMILEMGIPAIDIADVVVVR